MKGTNATGLAVQAVPADHPPQRRGALGNRCSREPPAVLSDARGAKALRGGKVGPRTLPHGRDLVSYQGSLAFVQVPAAMHVLKAGPAATMASHRKSSTGCDTARANSAAARSSALALKLRSYYRAGTAGSGRPSYRASRGLPPRTTRERHSSDLASASAARMAVVTESIRRLPLAPSL
jgi:hypothetical protein